jgi:hypothetical protein
VSWTTMFAQTSRHSPALCNTDMQPKNAGSYAMPSEAHK